MIFNKPYFNKSCVPEFGSDKDSRPVIPARKY